MDICLLTVVSSEQESDSKEEDSFKTEALHTLDKLTKALDQWETQQLLGGQYDKLGAILSIQVGTAVFNLSHVCVFTADDIQSVAAQSLCVHLAVAVRCVFMLQTSLMLVCEDTAVPPSSACKPTVTAPQVPHSQSLRHICYVCIMISDCRRSVWAGCS